MVCYSISLLRHLFAFNIPIVLSFYPSFLKCAVYIIDLDTEVGRVDVTL